MGSDRVPDNLWFRGQGVKVCERLLARPHAAERLGLPHPYEQVAHGGSGGETEPGHDVLAPEERRRRLDRLLLLPAAQEVADQRRVAPDAEGRGAGHGGRVRQRQEQQVLRILAQVTVETVARAWR